jgi:hypothetical protein
MAHEIESSAEFLFIDGIAVDGYTKFRLLLKKSLGKRPSTEGFYAFTLNTSAT